MLARFRRYYLALLLPLVLCSCSTLPTSLSYWNSPAGYELRREWWSLDRALLRHEIRHVDPLWLLEQRALARRMLSARPETIDWAAPPMGRLGATAHPPAAPAAETGTTPPRRPLIPLHGW